MADVSTTACIRCRKQKLRCSREQPECARCVKAGYACSFPDPPDRKALSAQRELSKKRPSEESDHVRRQRVSIGDQFQASSPRSPSRLMDHEAAGPSPATSAATASTVSAAGGPVSDKILRIFADVYFLCAFNSTLTFHRPTFDRALEEKSLAQHTLSAVSAYATSFLTSKSALGRQYASDLRPLGNVKQLGRQWALDAGKEVLQGIDQPTLQSIQTCQILALYWFSRGDSGRNAMFSAIAFRAIRARMLNQQSTASSGRWLEAEIERRCFWAAWIMNGINSDHYVQGTSADRLALTTSLPINETSYQEGIREPLLSLSSLPSNEISTMSPSVMAELIKIISIWTRIRDQIEARSTCSTQETLMQLFALDESLSKWSSSLHVSLVYSKRNLYEYLVVKQQPVFPVIHAVHQQCRLVLYSSIVPQFSGMMLKNLTPPEIVPMSAQIALKSAKGLSDIGANLLALEWDSAQIASFFGYCMYAAASVHMTLIFSSDISVANEASQNLTSNLTVLKAMKPYWKVLEKLWTRVCLLYEGQLSKRDEEAKVSDEAEDDSHNLDKVAAKERDTRRLAEPLRTSVLQYSLDKLKGKDGDPSLPAAGRFDRAMHIERVAALMTETSSPASQPSPESLGSTVPSRAPAPLPSVNHTSTSPLPTGESYPSTNTNLASLNAFDTVIPEEWEAEFGTLPQGWLSAEDFFSNF